MTDLLLAVAGICVFAAIALAIALVGREPRSRKDAGLKAANKGIADVLDDQLREERRNRTERG